MAGSKAGIGAVALLPLITVAGLILYVVVIAAPSATACGSGTASAAKTETITTETVVAGYNAAQLQSAAQVMNVAADMGLPREAQVVGLMAAMGRSGLAISPPNSESDELGLFAQDSSWGPAASRLDPVESSRLFFLELQSIPSWIESEPSRVLSGVLQVADPFEFEPYQSAAETIVSELSGTPGQCATGDLRFPLSPGFNMTSGYGPRNIDVAGASKWHPAVDLQHSGDPCGDPVYAVMTGIVTLTQNSQVSIQHPDGFTISYLHMAIENVRVTMGTTVEAGQQIGAVGNEGPSSGCHLDLRINMAYNTNAILASLPLSDSLGAPVLGYVNPEEFYAFYGLELCPTSECTRF